MKAYQGCIASLETTQITKNISVRTSLEVVDVNLKTTTFQMLRKKRTRWNAIQAVSSQILERQ